MFIYRQTSNQTFRTATLEVLWNLIPNIQSARSAAATYWIFITVLDFLHDEPLDALPLLSQMLSDNAKRYADGFTEIQKMFDTKYVVIDFFIVFLFLISDKIIVENKLEMYFLFRFLKYYLYFLFYFYHYFQ